MEIARTVCAALLVIAVGALLPMPAALGALGGMFLASTLVLAVRVVGHPEVEDEWDGVFAVVLFVSAMMLLLCLAFTVPLAV